jgi:hypothetical protein
VNVGGLGNREEGLDDGAEGKLKDGEGEGEGEGEGARGFDVGA